MNNPNSTLGVKSITNGSVMLIEINNDGDQARIGGVSPRWQDIKFNLNGDPYVTHYGQKHYLSEFQRIHRTEIVETK